jgi:hypothetical protein
MERDAQYGIRNWKGSSGKDNPIFNEDDSHLHLAREQAGKERPCIHVRNCAHK